MHLIDWILVGGSLLLVLFIGLYTQRYVRSVADFLSAGRVARRYLLAVATGEMAAGAVLYVAFFEQLRGSGFSTWWWGYLGGPIGMIIVISGFVLYPLVDNYIKWQKMKETDTANFQLMLPDGTHPNKNGSLAVNWPNIQELLESSQKTAMP